MLRFFTNNDMVCKDCKAEEVYKVIASFLSNLEITSMQTVNVEYETDANTYSAEFQLVPKGGKFFIREVFNDIPLVVNEKLPTVYLVMVNPEYNNYKFYKLEDAGNEVLATYGRIGANANEMFGTRTHSYPKRMYYVKLLEKLAKGYKDMTEIYCPASNKIPEKELPEAKNEPENPNTPSAILYNMLLQYAKHTVSENLLVTTVTQQMCDAAEEYIQQLYEQTESTDVEDFNQIYLQLLAVSPRNVRDISTLLARSSGDYANIIAKEESLLMAMQAVATKSVVQKKPTADFGPIKVHIATEKQKAEVMRHLSDNLKNQVVEVYRVINPEHKKRFNDYLKQNNIKKVKQLWHGSRNENWLSIIQQGLLLKPNAVITGKMFGDGIYFAPSSMKSWGYTSGRGSYWAKGSQDKCFMGLYATAFGVPYDTTAPQRFTQSFLKTQNKNCVYAHAGSYLRNDEIIFYDERAFLLNYIVEFKA